MKYPLRSSVCTEGRRMAGARALWVANGMKREQFGKPIIAIVNSFTQFVPGHTHLHEIGQIVKSEIEAMGCYAAELPWGMMVCFIRCHRAMLLPTL